MTDSKNDLLEKDIFEVGLKCGYALSKNFKEYFSGYMLARERAAYLKGRESMMEECARVAETYDGIGICDNNKPKYIIAEAIRSIPADKEI